MANRVVVVQFRDRKFTYSYATGWQINEQTGRLSVMGPGDGTNGMSHIATFNEGVWDMVMFVEISTETTTHALAGSRANERAVQAFERAPGQQVSVDFKDGRRSR